MQKTGREEDGELLRRQCSANSAEWGRGLETAPHALVFVFLTWWTSWEEMVVTWATVGATL